MIPIAKPFLGEDEKAAVLDVLLSGMLSQGAKVKEFEESFASFVGTKYAVATSNGTTALHAALLAHGICSGDEVITTPFTFIATANAITMTGAKPVFVDIEENTFNLNPNLLEAAITEKTKAILPVHLFGRSADMKKIQEIAEKHNLLVIEDACQAHGAATNNQNINPNTNQKVGSFGTACFSFYPTKNMTTGEGGIITTDNFAIAENLRKIISHGSSQRYYHDFVGYNYRMTDLAAAIGIVQLKKLNYFNLQRKQNAQYLNEQLRTIKGIKVPENVSGHVFHQYTIIITPDFGYTRDQVKSFLTEKGIGSSVFYPLPIHQQKAYESYNNQSFPVTEKLSQQVLSLPVHPLLNGEDLQKIVNAIKELSY